MVTIHKETIKWNNIPLSIETGRIGRQADGSVIITYGGTTVLCTSVTKKQAEKNTDFFPLTVNYQERFYSTGRIPGGFFKRETRPTEKEILISRLIDRPIRPLFKENFKNETQIIATVLSYDINYDPDILAIIGASTVITLSGVPFSGPIAAIRIGYKDGKYLLNPSKNTLQESDLELIVAGTKDSVLMIESEAKELSEDIMLKAIEFAHNNYQPIIETILKLKNKINNNYKWNKTKEHPEKQYLNKKLSNLFIKKIKQAYNIKTKQERQDLLFNIKNEAIASLTNTDITETLIIEAFTKLEKNIIKEKIIQNNIRIDGRTSKEIRNITSKVDLFHYTHGSALFTRGETQVIAITTLGTSQDEQIIDSVTGEYKERFLLHYNFPPYSVGEIGRIGFPGRREIGHGKLAWRALKAVLPSIEHFDYTIRLVSEVTESNGSSSMATVCGGTLSMMDAGVPLTRPVAGIAMGVIETNKDPVILSDISGEEDHLGGMDLKVAGSKNGITALQMDVKKINLVSFKIIDIAIKQAKEGIIHIINEMKKTLSCHRDTVRNTAPIVIKFNIPLKKIKEVIGTGGKIIRDISEKTNTKINISDKGLVKVFGENKQSAIDGVKKIRDIVVDPELGSVYHGTIVKIMDFGVFVNFTGLKDGLLHINELAKEPEISNFIKKGNKIYVKLISMEAGRIKLTIKSINQKTGQLIDSSGKPINPINPLIIQKNTLIDQKHKLIHEKSDPNRAEEDIKRREILIYKLDTLIDETNILIDKDKNKKKINQEITNK